MITDPYPETLIDEPLVPVEPADPLVRAVNRLAQAVEQNTLALLDRPGTPVVVAPTLAALPPVQRTAPPQGGVCPIHNVPWKVVPAGIAKRGPRAGQPFDAFQACSVSGCDQRPPRR